MFSLKARWYLCGWVFIIRSLKINGGDGEDEKNRISLMFLVIVLIIISISIVQQEAATFGIANKCIFWSNEFPRLASRTVAESGQALYPFENTNS